MKLLELFSDSIDLANYVKGSEKSAKGSFARVYEVKGQPDLVLKVYKKDLPYDHFIDNVVPYAKEMCIGAEHFPVIHDKWETSEGTAVLMERLLPLDHHLVEEFYPDEDFKYEYGMNCDVEAWMWKYSPSFDEACQLVLDMLSGWFPDMHDNNVMMRRDGTLVIIDPYFT